LGRPLLIKLLLLWWVLRQRWFFLVVIAIDLWHGVSELLVLVRVVVVYILVLVQRVRRQDILIIL
jgi:hypothetical protein